ncbi:MAG: PGN_0703 family putative restriction endonuclease [Nitrospiraceae bacterium]
MFEERKDGKTPWVLKTAHKEKNLKEARWWQYIVGKAHPGDRRKEHTWVGSLNSSQCFAVNLFGPLKDDPLLARRVLAELIPDRAIQQEDEVTVEFEHTPEGAPGWLGETKTSQPTQVDVFFTVSRNGITNRVSTR